MLSNLKARSLSAGPRRATTQVIARGCDETAKFFCRVSNEPGNPKVTNFGTARREVGGKADSRVSTRVDTRQNLGILTILTRDSRRIWTAGGCSEAPRCHPHPTLGLQIIKFSKELGCTEWGYTAGELTGGAFNNATFGVPLGESMARVMGSNLSDLAKGWVTTDLHVQDFHSGQFGKIKQQQAEALQKDGLASLSVNEKEKMMTGYEKGDFHSGQFGKTKQQQAEALQKDGLASLSVNEKEKMMTGYEKGGFHDGQFGKTKQQQAEALQKDGLASLSVNEKEKMMTGFLNSSTFGDKGSIEQKVARTLGRVDISDEKKLDITTKVKSRGLTTLGANIQLESATSDGEIRAATGRISQCAARAGSLPHNELLARVDGIWEQVVKIAPEISWIDESSKDESSKESWWLKVWAAGETLNPPKCRQWAGKLKTKEVATRIAHYVNSKAPQARHARLRELLPLLASAMAAYRTAKNRKTKATWNRKNFK